MGVAADISGAPGGVEVAQSSIVDSATAVHEILDQIRADEAVFSFVFFGPTHDAEVVAKAQADRVGARGVAGSTAGELSGAGFTHGGMVGLALHGAHVRAASTVVQSLGSLSLMPVTNIAQDLARRIGRRAEELDPSRHMWLLLFDGLSGKEDFLTPYFARHAPRIPIVGGSVADDGEFERASLIFDGHVYEDAATVVLIEYSRPFELLHHTHMEFTEHSFEVTNTARSGRLLMELDGRPAREVYAEALGVKPCELTLELTGHRPFGYRFKGRPFPCSVMTAVEEGLLLAYSVQLGDTLHLLRPTDLVGRTRAEMRAAIDKLGARGGEPRAGLLFNCFGRYLEARFDGTVEPLAEALHQLPICGLNTYGEQFAARHMNHSLTGVLFG